MIEGFVRYGWEDASASGYVLTRTGAADKLSTVLALVTLYSQFETMLNSIAPFVLYDTIQYCIDPTIPAFSGILELCLKFNAQYVFKPTTHGDIVYGCLEDNPVKLFHRKCVVQEEVK